MLYTRKGDDGTTSLYHCDQRLTKDGTIAEALGTVDELNSMMGWLKVGSGKAELAVLGTHYADICEEIQQALFVVQAELAGADKQLEERDIKQLEEWIDTIEQLLPPITSFLIPGGTEIAVRADIARTVARRAERRCVSVLNEGKLSKTSYQYLNRLSSLCYALARFANDKAGTKEDKPHY